MPGPSLQERLDAGGPLRLDEVLAIGLQVARGLAAARPRGLVHRDVKPANILPSVGNERQKGTSLSLVKLTDFGMARAVDDPRLTQSGVVSGTPLCMAPEQARDEPQGHRADLFSLDGVLYATCTRQAPFCAASTPAVLRRICEEEPVPVRAIDPAVPECLAAPIARTAPMPRAMTKTLSDTTTKSRAKPTTRAAACMTDKKSPRWRMVSSPSAVARVSTRGFPGAER